MRHAGSAATVVVGLNPTGLGAVRSLDKALSRDIPIRNIIARASAPPN